MGKIRTAQLGSGMKPWTIWDESDKQQLPFIMEFGKMIEKMFGGNFYTRYCEERESIGKRSFTFVKNGNKVTAGVWAMRDDGTQYLRHPAAYVEEESKWLAYLRIKGLERPKAPLPEPPKQESMLE